MYVEYGPIKLEVIMNAVEFEEEKVSLASTLCSSL